MTVYSTFQTEYGILLMTNERVAQPVTWYKHTYQAIDINSTNKQIQLQLLIFHMT